MLERFTVTARQVVLGAEDEARTLGHSWIGTEHLLLATLRQPEAPGAATLVRLGVSAETCRTAIASVVSGQGDALGPEDAEALKAFGIDLEEIRRRAEGAFGDGALDAPVSESQARRRRSRPFGRRRRKDGTAAEDGGTGRSDRWEASGHLRFTGRAKKAVELALREAIARKERHIGVEHLVLALLRGDDKISLKMFQQLGVTPKDVRDLVLADLRTAA